MRFAKPQRCLHGIIFWREGERRSTVRSTQQYSHNNQQQRSPTAAEVQPYSAQPLVAQEYTVASGCHAKNRGPIVKAWSAAAAGVGRSHVSSDWACANDPLALSRPITFE